MFYSYRLDVSQLDDKREKRFSGPDSDFVIMCNNNNNNNNNSNNNIINNNNNKITGIPINHVVNVLRLSQESAAYIKAVDGTSAWVSVLFFVVTQSIIYN